MGCLLVSLKVTGISQVYHIWVRHYKLNIFVEAGKIAVPLRNLNHSLVLSYQKIKVYANIELALSYNRRYTVQYQNISSTFKSIHEANIVLLNRHGDVMSTVTA